MIKREKWRKGKGIIAKNVKIGKGTRIWHYCNLYDCEIGENCIIGSFVEIGRSVKIGNYCKIQSGTFIPEGVILESGVFVGPYVVFTNDKYPKARPCIEVCEGKRGWTCISTLVKEGASIGANATILCGITIGKHALIGCGAVVSKDVPDYAVVVGNPARVVKYLCR